MELELEVLDLGALARRWWAPVLRGVVAITFGVVALAWPAIGLIALVSLFGAYAVLDGLLNLVLAYEATERRGRWGWILVESVVSIAVGLVTFFWPGITVVVLLSLIIAWAVLTGIAEIYAAIRLRRQLRGEWLLIASGGLSIAFGVLLYVFPGAGTLALVWLIGAYAVLFGALLIGFGIRLHGLARRGRGELPSGGAPTPA